MWQIGEWGACVPTIIVQGNPTFKLEHYLGPFENNGTWQDITQTHSLSEGCDHYLVKWLMR